MADTPTPERLLTLTKSVDPGQVSPGGTFTYTIYVGCNQDNAGCIDSVITDPLPSEFAGFALTAVSIDHTGGGAAPTATWEGLDGAALPATVSDASTITVTPQQSLPNGNKGIAVGQGVTVTLTLQVPSDLAPTWPFNGEEIVNRAEATAANSLPASQSVPVTVNVAQSVNVGASKQWAPASATLNPGTVSTITVGAKNASNVPVDTLVIQEPAAAADLATALDPSNPFTIVDFSGFGDGALPEGATAVQTEVYVLVDGVYRWQVAGVGAEPTLGAIAPADVAGVRLTYTGEAIAVGASAGTPFDVAQRELIRGTDEPVAAGTVNNVLQATAKKDGVGEKSATAGASHSLVKADVGASITKDIAPERQPAGANATATLQARNTGTDAETMTIGDHGYFQPGVVTFGGFTESPTPPSTTGDAAAGSVTFEYFDGTSEVVPVIAGAVPAPGAPKTPGDVAGFDITWTAAEGSLITRDESATATFVIASAEDAATTDEPVRETLNEATVEVVTPFGTAGDDDDAPFTLIKPSLEVDLAKSITPADPVRPGDQVVAQLVPSFTTSASHITPTVLEVEDSLAQSSAEANGGFWNGFDLYSIAPTGVPGGTGLSIKVQVGGEWVELGPWEATSGSRTVALTHAELAAKLAALDPAATTSDVTGVRFTFTNPQGVSGTAKPNLTYVARTDKRDGTGETSTPGGEATTYVNVATTKGEGKDSEGKSYSDTDEATSQGAIIIPGPGPGVGPDFHIGKDWKVAATGPDAAEPLPALSRDHAWTALTWRIDPPAAGSFGAAEATLQDHGTVTDHVAATVYDAFDLLAIEGIGNSATVGSNGWALRWDKITAIEIFDGETWSTPAGATALLSDGNAVNVNAAGTSANLPRIALTPAESASTVALRITLEPNLDTRANAIAAGVSDVPGLNSGVVSTSRDREFRLEWELRNTLRSAPETWVAPATEFNGGVNTIDNAVTLTVDERSKDATDFITLVSKAPSVRIDKSASPTSVLVPGEDVAPSAYPTTTFTSVARSEGPAAPTYLRISDPMPCIDTAVCAYPNTLDAVTADPFETEPEGGWLRPTGGSDNPFDSFTVTKISATTEMADADLDRSVAWLLRYSAAEGSYSSTSLSVRDLNDLAAADLADVVGVAVTYAGKTPQALIPEGAAFTLAIDAQLRPALRSDDSSRQLEPNTSAEVINTAFAQVWEPHLNMTPADKPVTDTDDATVVLNGQSIKVAPGKTIVPGSIIAAKRETPVSVVLAADDADSTLAPKQVWLEDTVDTSAQFWGAFELTGLNEGLVAPANADRVQIDLRLGAAWVTGAPSAIDAAALPAVGSLEDVVGVRVTFSRADGAFFNTADWQTSVPLAFGVRDSYAFPASGEKTFTNLMKTQSVRDISDPDGADNSLVVTDDATITLGSGFFAISVNKLANGGNRSVEVGVPTPWTLSFTNTGTGALTITRLTDFLGDSNAGERVEGSSHLVPAAPLNLRYGTSDGGTLATEGIVYTYDDSLGELVFTWPDGGRSMAPGETFTIALDLELLPGLQSGDMAFNTMNVDTEQVLTGSQGAGVPPYTNSDPVMQENPNNGSWGGESTAGTKDYVQPRATLNLWVQKAVYGSRGTAATPSGELCSATVPGPDDVSYFPSPCLSDTQYSTDDSIVDKWLLRTSNTTTTPVKELVLFDDLPVLGDKMLIGGAGRGSNYRPVLVGTPVVHLPDGVEGNALVEVTQNVDSCQGTWNDIVDNPGATPCSKNGATWTAASTDTDWSMVAGLRIRIVFAEGKYLGNGQTVDVTFETRNVVDPAGETTLSATAPVPDQEAWNQFGIQWQFANEQWSQRIPARVGVTPGSGPLEIRKVVDGAGAPYAPSSFTFQVTCSATQPTGYETTAITLPNQGLVTVTKNEDGGYTPARIDGIPIGADCTVTETLTGGATNHTVTPGSVTISQPAGASDDVPQAQIVTATNLFDVGSLSVIKKVTGAGAQYGKGPFTLQVACTFNGAPVDLADGGTVTLPGPDGTLTAQLDGLPVGAECTVTETESGGATSTGVVPSKAVITSPSEASDSEASQPAVVTVTNDFEVGGLLITKELAGEGAGSYGQGPFTFQTTCEFEGRAVDLGTRATVSLPTAQGAWSSAIEGIPVGATCVVSETVSGGATTSALYPKDGKVVVPRPGDGEKPTLALVSATNTFDVGALTLTKKVTGAGADEYGKGPFAFQTMCTFTKDGQELAITLPDAGSLALPTPAGAWTHTYSDLIVGATCVVTETGSAGATSSAMSPANGTVTIPPLKEGKAQAALVEVTNTFDVGTVGVQKLVTGDFALTDEELKDLAFTVTWTADNGESGTLTLDSAGDWRSATKGLPVGTTVSFTEVAMPELAPHVGFDGYAWAEAPGVAVSDDGKVATVVVGAEPVALAVTNEFSLLTGSFGVEKQIGGDFGPDSPEFGDEGFEIAWTASDGSAGTLALTAEGGWYTKLAESLRTGTTVELTELAVTGLPPYVQWDGYAWLPGEGITLSEDGRTATIVIGNDTTTALQVENTFSELLGGFDITKDVAGDGADRVSDDTPFVVEYSVDAGITWTALAPVTKAAPTVEGPQDLRLGTEVLVREVAPSDQPDVEWGTPAFSGAGVLPGEGGKPASFVITDADASLAVLLTNPTTPLNGQFAVTKSITGTGASLMVGDPVFTVRFAYEGLETPQVLTVKAGQLTSSAGSLLLLARRRRVS